MRIAILTQLHSLAAGSLDWKLQHNSHMLPKNAEILRFRRFSVSKRSFRHAFVSSRLETIRTCIGLRARQRRTLARLEVKIPGACPGILKIVTLFSRLRAGKLCEATRLEPGSVSFGRGFIDSLKGRHGSACHCFAAVIHTKICLKSLKDFRG